MNFCERLNKIKFYVDLTLKPHAQNDFKTFNFQLFDQFLKSHKTFSDCEQNYNSYIYSSNDV